jgi:spore maturation protein CgeB
MAAYDLRHYDGVLAFGDVVRDLYLKRGWASRAWTWHEAADTGIFYPRRHRKAPTPRYSDTYSGTYSGTDSDTDSGTYSDTDSGTEDYDGDVVWIGNWGDEERTAELDEFLLQPVRELGLRAAAYGVRYPADARIRLAISGVSYRGWLPNTHVPEVFARYKVTVHIPRRPYLDALPGIPTIRPFEALACGIPLICARWHQTGGLFTPGQDFLVAEDGRQMTALLAALVSDPDARHALAARGLQTIAAHHTCAHRVDELLAICEHIPMEAAAS